MTRIRTVFAASQIGMASMAWAADPPGEVRPQPSRVVYDVSRYPLEVQRVMHPLIALDALRIAAHDPPEKNMNERFNNGKQATLYRWTHLTAQRRNIDYYDTLCGSAAHHEREYHKAYAATSDPAKTMFTSHASHFKSFYARRIYLRESWYYSASYHHSRWEEDRKGGPILNRAEKTLCGTLGCNTWEFEKFLAWVDLWATYLLPGYLSQVLTGPLAFLS